MRHRVDHQAYKSVKNTLKKLGATTFQLSKPEVKELPKVLFEEETIEAFVMGLYEGGYGMLVATNKRLIFLDVMPFGRIIVDDIPYDIVNSTEMQLGLFFGTITVFTRTKDFRFWWLNQNVVQNFNAYIEQRMLEEDK